MYACSHTMRRSETLGGGLRKGERGCGAGGEGGFGGVLEIMGGFLGIWGGVGWGVEGLVSPVVGDISGLVLCRVGGGVTAEGCLLLVLSSCSLALG